MDLSNIGNFLTNNSSTIGGMLGTGSQLYGQQNAGEAISKASTAGIGQANTTMGNINSLYKPQTTLGNGAMSTLGSSLGLNGQPANYNNFLNMPGYQFAVNQGTQAIQRQAASMGSAYTPNTAQAVGQYVTGTAMQDYNNYISQLQQSAQLGASANQTLSGANLQTAGNIEQLGTNAGMAQAGMYTGMGQSVAGGVNGTGVGRGAGGSGGGSGAGGAVSLLGGGLNLLGKYLSGSGSSTGAGSSSGGYDPYAGFDTSNLGNLNFNGGSNPYSGFDTSNLGNLDFGPSYDQSAGSDFSNMNSGFDSGGYGSGF